MSTRDLETRRFATHRATLCTESQRVLSRAIKICTSEPGGFSSALVPHPKRSFNSTCQNALCAVLSSSANAGILLPESLPERGTIQRCDKPCG